jgi:GNAT superfamily N-acetyltransferase
MTMQSEAAGAGGVSMRPMSRDERDLELLRACFAKNSDRPRSRAALSWQYLANTTPHLFVDLAVAPGGDRLAAIYASLPGWVRAGGERRLALQSLDTLTDAEHRGKGLFVKLARQTFARASGEGAALIYGFPNGSSARGFFGKLGWTSLDPVPFLIRPLRARYVAERLAERFKLGPTASRLAPDVSLVLGGRRRRPGVVELTASDERITRLWGRFSRDVGVAVERDAGYFRWRVFDKPGERYRVIASEEGDEIRALCAYTVKEKHGGRIGYVLELMHDPGAPRAASHLLGLAVRDMADQGADSVLAWSMTHSPNFLAYASHGFFPLPERLRPIELHVGARAFDPAIASRVTDRREWYLSYLDSDTV